MSNELLEKWAAWHPEESKADGGRLYHIDDAQAVAELDAAGNVAPRGMDWSAYTTSQRFGRDDAQLHLGLTPIPFLGNVRKAKVVVLLQNPGLSPSDYYAEHCASDLRDRLRENLSGDGCSGEFPFLFLNPEYSWHAGFDWWQGKLGPVIAAVAAGLQLGPDLRTARKHVAQHVAAIELLPYHSKSGVLTDGQLGCFESVRWARDYVRHLATASGTKVVVARHAARWGMESFRSVYPNFLVYERQQGRPATFNPAHQNGGGRMIVDAVIEAVRAGG